MVCAGCERFNAPVATLKEPNSGDCQGTGFDAFPFSQPKTQKMGFFISYIYILVRESRCFKEEVHRPCLRESV